MTRERTIALAGAGEIGTSALGHLLAHLPDARFRVFDDRADALERAQRLDPARVDGRAVRLDAEAAAQLDGCELVLSTAGPFFVKTSTAVARAALAAGCRYVDICDDAEGVRALEGLRDEAVAAGRTLLTGAGFSPGLSNVWARRLVDVLPDVDGIDVAWVVHEPEPGGLAALHHLMHMATAPSAQFVDGKLAEEPGFVPATAKRVRFADPVGEAEVFNAPHPEPVTLPWALPALRRVRCLGGLLPEWANTFFSTAARLGFSGGAGPVLLDGREVDPVEVLWRALWSRYEARGDHGDAGYCALQVLALVGDRPVGEVSVFDDATMARATGLGAAAIAVEALDAETPVGLWGPEVLDAERTLATFGAMADRAGAFAGARDVLPAPAAHGAA